MEVAFCFIGFRRNVLRYDDLGRQFNPSAKVTQQVVMTVLGHLRPLQDPVTNSSIVHAAHDIWQVSRAAGDDDLVAIACLAHFRYHGGSVVAGLEGE